MFTHNIKPNVLVLFVASFAISPLYAQERDFKLGTAVTAEDLAKIDIDIMPDGTGLPEGAGSYTDGAAVYEVRCASCHGDDLAGTRELGAPALVGGRGSLATDAPVKTVESYWPHASTVFDYIRRAMPMDAPGSLTDSEVYAVTAFILGRGGILAEGVELDADRLRTIEMPNKGGFTSDPRPETY